ncbi:MAG: hypothetical protein JO022_04700 [Acidobacteriaceae bacterium]|nr:hypothetical protein [Acidobacteriaceae bacterium]
MRGQIVATRCGVNARREPHVRPKERGSALLIVFVFAAVIAIMLYREMPVAAFEAQREKEQLLVDRGHEYVRAVQLFYRRNRGQFPASIQQLEDTNRIRFLRRKYKDPFTGKDDWRLLHAGPGGMLLDSKVNPIPNQPGSQNAAGTQNGAGAFGTFNNGMPGSQSTLSGASSPTGIEASEGDAAIQQPAAAMLAQRRRAMRLNAVGTPMDSNSPEPDVPARSNMDQEQSAQTQPGNSDPFATQTAGAAGFGNQAAPGNAMATVNNPNAANNPNAMGPNGMGPNGMSPNGVALNGMPPNGASPNAAGNPDPNMAQPGMAQQNMAQPGMAQANNMFPQSQPSGGTQQPGGLIDPRTGRQQRSGFGSSGQMMGGALAGVASTVHGRGILRVNDQTDYALWEFYYNPMKDTTAGAQMPRPMTSGTNLNGTSTPGFGPQSSTTVGVVGAGAGANNGTDPNAGNPGSGNPGGPNTQATPQQQ